MGIVRSQITAWKVCGLGEIRQGVFRRMIICNSESEPFENFGAGSDELWFVSQQQDELVLVERPKIGGLALRCD